MENDTSAALAAKKEELKKLIEDSKKKIAEIETHEENIAAATKLAESYRL